MVNGCWLFLVVAGAVDGAGVVAVALAAVGVVVVVVIVCCGDCLLW